MNKKTSLPVLLLFWVTHLAGQTTSPANRWIDKSLHKSGFVTVNGVQLHFLDWGGKGETLLFLHGLGGSAHIFDEVAPKFTDRFRVLALTRRGHGQSDKPGTGYATGTLVEDIRQFLDHLNVKRVSLVGHSMADKELTLFASLYPDRIGKLVYLDAAYDRSALRELSAKDPLPSPRPSKVDQSSFEAYHRWWLSVRGFWSDAVEADLRETSLALGDTIKPSVSGKVVQEILKGADMPPMDYTKVKAPALSFYAIVGTPRWLPPDADEATRHKVQSFLNEVKLPYQRENIERFQREMARGYVVELKNSDHFVFIVSQDTVVQQMWKFLLDE